MPLSAALREGGVPEVLTLAGVRVEHRRGGETAFRALDIERLDIAAGSSHGVSGPSGAGKSTLLHLVAGLIRPSVGEVRWGDLRIDDLGEAARGRFRRETIGFVFQDFHLVDELSVLDNVLLPACFDRLRPAVSVVERARSLVRRMGLDDERRQASKLSRGERQRVAVARALLLDPRLILADEPTASLDAENGEAVGRLLVEAARENGATLVVAAHDPALLARLDHVHRLVGGRLVEEVNP